MLKRVIEVFVMLWTCNGPDSEFLARHYCPYTTITALTPLTIVTGSYGLLALATGAPYRYTLTISTYTL